MKTFCSANNVYFVKNTNIFSKKKVFFNLVLQQMNNHKRWTFWRWIGLLDNHKICAGEIHPQVTKAKNRKSKGTRNRFCVHNKVQTWIWRKAVFHDIPFIN